MSKTKEWHENRRQGITGTDCAAIMGISPYHTPIDVYYEKINGYVEYDNDMLKRGRRLEKYVLEEYVEHTGEVLEVDLPMLQDAKYPFLRGNIDAKVKDKNIIIEAKSSMQNPSSWGGKIPDHYIIQVAHYAAVADAERVDIPVLFDRWEYACFTYYRDEELENKIRKAAIDFWHNHIIPQIPPSPQSVKDVLKIYPTNTEGKIIEANNEIETKITELVDITQKIKLLSKQEEDIKLELMTYMQDAEQLNSSNKYSISWKQYQQKRLNTNKLKENEPTIYNKYLNIIDYRPFKLKTNFKGEKYNDKE